MNAWARSKAVVSAKLERLVARSLRNDPALARPSPAPGDERVDEPAHEAVAALATRVKRLEETMEVVYLLAIAAFDDVPGLRRKLLEARDTERYARAYDEPEPLVSVRIPTYVRVDTLMERAIPSILRQTYQHFEVIVVGDGCTNDTGERIAALGDPRVTFENLPTRYPYPEHPHHRWLVAGTPGLNRGAERANGLWIATLFDDDEYEPDHLEQLLARARATRAEMVYGKLLQLAPDPADDKELCVYPPTGPGDFGMHGALVNAALRFFEFEINAWLLGEPGDWNVCRRMVEAGVHIEFLDRVVTRYYPSLFYGRDDGPA